MKAKMPVDWDDDPDEEWIVDEGDEEDDVLACPSCGGQVHEDAQQCPHCGDWIVPVDPRDRSRRLLWIIITLALILALALITIR